MSTETTTSQPIKSRAAFFDAEAVRAKEAAAKAFAPPLAKIPFHHPSQILPTWQHPTGNPDLVSITGYVPGPQGKAKPNWYRPPARVKKDLPPAGGH